MSMRMYVEYMANRHNAFAMDHLFRALADRTRLRLLNLMAGQEICVCYFVEITGESQPKISRHLAYLRRAGVVASRREGKWMHYRITEPEDVSGKRVLREVLMWLQEDKAMQADHARLTRVCCKPEKYVAIQGAPMPISLLSFHRIEAL